MGKGASTSKADVKKRLPDYNSDQSPRGGGSSGSGAEGGAKPEGELNICLITFREKLTFNQNAADLIKVGFKFTLVSGEGEALDVVASGRVIGEYAGAKLALLKQCIGSGYIYRGAVRTVDGNGADCEITGFGVGDGTASTM